MNLDHFHAQMHLGPLLGLHRPTPALIHAILDLMAVIKHYWKRRKKLGPATGQPTPLVGRARGGAPLFNPVHREPMVLPLLEFHQFHFMFFLPLLPLLWFLSKFIRKRRKRFPSLALSFAFRVYLLPFTRTSLWWYNYPARMVLWCVIAHKNDFVECYHPQEWFLWEATKPRKDY